MILSNLINTTSAAAFTKLSEDMGNSLSTNVPLNKSLAFSISIEETANTASHDKNVFVKRLYVTIACMIVLTVILYCANWLLKGHKTFMKLRRRIKCWTQEPQHIPPKVKVPRRNSEAPHSFNGLFVFNMRNVNN